MTPMMIAMLKSRRRRRSPSSERLVDDLGDARNALGQGERRFSLIFRADEAPEVHLAILHGSAFVPNQPAMGA